MPQELHVLRCYACKKFQVQIVKKVPKWQCKICNEKQSVLKVYAQGSGKDCRQYVQDLNFKQGFLSSQEPTLQTSLVNNFTDQQMSPCSYDSVHKVTKTKVSKWSEYLEGTHCDIAYDEELCDVNQTWTSSRNDFTGEHEKITRDNKNFPGNDLIEAQDQHHGGMFLPKIKRRKLIDSDNSEEYLICDMAHEEPSFPSLKTSSEAFSYVRHKGEESSFQCKDNSKPNCLSNNNLKCSHYIPQNGESTVMEQRYGFSKYSGMQAVSQSRYQCGNLPKSSVPFCLNVSSTPSSNFSMPGDNSESKNRVVPGIPCKTQSPFVISCDDDNLDSILDL